MSFDALQFVRRLRGFRPPHNLVLRILADHDNHKGGGSYPSMTTIAEEAGYAHRQNVSDIVQEIAATRIIFADKRSRGRKTTVWYFNYAMVGVDPSITLAPKNRSRGAAVNRNSTAAVGTRQPQSEIPATAVGENLNRSRNDSQPQSHGCTKVLEGGKQEGERSLMQSSSRSGAPENAGASPSPSLVEKELRKVADQKGVGPREGMTPEQLQARSEFLKSQQPGVLAKFR